MVFKIFSTGAVIGTFFMNIILCRDANLRSNEAGYRSKILKITN